MKSPRTIVASALLLTLPIAACNGLHTPSAAEAGSKKVAHAAARSTALARLIAFGPDAVGKTTTGEGEGAPGREVTQPMIPPAQAAKELRQLASEVSSAGGSKVQLDNAKTLATRMRRDAMMLDLMDLERVSQLMGDIAWDIGERVALVESIGSSGDLVAASEAGERLRAMRGARDAYVQALDALKAAGERARGALQPIEADIASKDKDAEQLDAEIQDLRLRSATSRASDALPLMVEARLKTNQAQDLRIAAASADRDAQPLRSDIRIAEGALAGADETSGSLGSRVQDAETAEQGAKARTSTAEKRRGELAAENAELAKEFARLKTESFDPAVKSVEENMQAGDIASKNSTDAAMMSMMKARLAVIRAVSVDQEMAVARATAAQAGDGGPLAAMRGERAKFMDAAKAAMIEARAALSGVDASQGGPMLSSLDEMAASLGIDISAAPAPAGSAASAEGTATTEGTDGAEGAKAADESKPARETSEPPAGGEPAPAGDAPQADPAPPTDPAPQPDPARPADPGEPNK